MKKFKLLRLIVLIVIVLGVVLLQSCENENDEYLFGTTTNIQVDKAFLLTRHSHPDFFSKEEGIKVDLVHKFYPKASFVFAVAFSAGPKLGIPVGVCIDNGLLINRLVSDSLGLLYMDSNGTIDIINPSRFSFEKTGLLKGRYESIIQLQMLMDDGHLILFNDDVEEEHFILEKDVNENLFVKYFKKQKLSDVVKALDNSNAQYALKLSSNAINGGFSFDDGAIVAIGDVERSSPNLIAVLILE